jgi:hypothetical protein
MSAFGGESVAKLFAALRARNNRILVINIAYFRLMLNQCYASSPSK